MKAELKPFSDQAKSMQIGSVYEHYSGKRYKILAVGRHSENLEECVVYQSLYGDNAIWIRPLKMFLEDVVIDEELRPRFACIQ